MGKEWLHWTGGGGGKSTKRGRLEGVHRDSPSGCMSAVLQLFDFHQSQFALHQEVPSFKPDSFLTEEPTILKGVEAPRNSLEKEEPFMDAATFSSTMKEEEALNIPMGIQIKTNGDTGRSKLGAPKARTDDLSSECSSSPGAKTPSLVARLMGLDLLPDSCSPSPSSSKHSTSNPPTKSHPHAQLHNLKQEFRNRQLIQSRSRNGRSLFDTDITGSRSLPETPRTSSARRSDVDRRLSLQINRENIGVSEEFESSGHSTMKTARRREVRQEDERKVKENVGRKVGMDITNTLRNREQGSDDHVVLLKAKKQSKGLARIIDESSSSSPRLRFLEVKNKQVTTPATKNQLTHSPKLSPSNKVSSKPRSEAALQELPQHHHQQQNPNQKCKKNGSDQRYSPRLKRPPQTSDVFRIRNKQEEPFVGSLAATNIRANISDKKCKKTTLSSELLNINVPTLFPVKKDPTSPTRKLPQKQSQVSDTLSPKRTTKLSSCSSQTYEQQATHTPTIIRNSSSVGGAEFQYVSGILKCTGIDLNTAVSFTKWYSPAHPLDPSIYHHLELSFPTTTTTQLRQSCNRKLIFQLVDEILMEILKPHMNLKAWVTSSVPYDHQMYGSQLIDTLCSKIRSFPSSDCRVLEDIDALVDKDLCRSQLRRSVALEEEGEAIVAELEQDLLESLVHETAVEVLFG